jgi:two-component system OmpR family response regulator
MNRRHNGHVLVVEDDPVIRDVLSELAHDRGFETAVAGNGRDALTLATADDPELVLLDLNMPVMDGPSFAREYRRRGGRAAILVLSSTPQATADLRGVQVDGFLQKPFRVEDVERALGNSLRR